MLENYIDQIITMGTLADSVTIIDDQQIIRHFQPFNPDIVPFTASDVVGTHFRSTFLDVDPADSGVLRALHGESTISRAYTHLLFNGQRSSDLPDPYGGFDHRLHQCKPLFKQSQPLP